MNRPPGLEPARDVAPEAACGPVQDFLKLPLPQADTTPTRDGSRRAEQGAPERTVRSAGEARRAAQRQDDRGRLLRPDPGARGSAEAGASRLSRLRRAAGLSGPLD